MESKMLLPGGSRVEGFAVDRSPRQQRRAAVLAICAVAAAACLASASVSRSSQAELVAITSPVAAASTVQLKQQKPKSKADAYLQKHGLPSWLSISDVKLKPLSTMIHEQLAVKEMKKKNVEKKMAKEEHKDEHEASPHALAMKNVLHSQAATKIAAKSVKVLAKRATAQSLSQVKAKTGADDETTAKPAYHKGAIKAANADLKKMKRGEREEELVVENSERRKLEAIRTEEQKVNKEEVHRLAAIKKADSKRETQIKKDIKALKAEKVSEQLSEKRSIKAEMAKIEDEEQEKLASLKKKMTVIAKGGVVEDAKPVAKDAKPAAKTQVAAAKTAATKARGHKVVQKPAVKVHVDAAVRGEDKKAAKAVKGASSLKAKTAAKTKTDCTTTKCDLAEEDEKWGAIGGKVDDYAREAARSHGSAKKAALAHMQYLQEQIEKDYTHVTGFAVAQEHALPPAPK